MTDEKDTPKDEPEQLTDEQLAEVAGGRPGGKPTTVTARLDGVNNDTLFAGAGDQAIKGIKGTDLLKKR